MNGPQYIFLGLIAITTWGAFIEATAYPRCRFTPGRLIVALIVPALWAALVIFMRWNILERVPRHPFVWFPAGILLCIFGPVSFVGTIVIWVGAALAGDLPNPITVLSQHLYKHDNDKE
ncbi:MAG: hypothetical protein M3347_18145 [Armatimonadota bacterium]|nr:hypothetical protein [Armatimonadota bacterium]